MEISIINLIIGVALIAIPAYILYYYRTNLGRNLLISTLRMVVQLFLVGFYLKYIFEWNNPYVNTLWLLIMSSICAIELLRRVKFPVKKLFVPFLISTILPLSFIAIYFLKLVLNLDSIFESRYFIPICGILLGNILSSNVIGLSTFYDNIHRQRSYYNYLICNGATLGEATKPFIKDALIRSFNPTIASMAVMGLISLPGTMIGQIMGGSSPSEAIRYQIMIMIIVSAANIISLQLTIGFVSRYIHKSVIS